MKILKYIGYFFLWILYYFICYAIIFFSIYYLGADDTILPKWVWISLLALVIISPLLSVPFLIFKIYPEKKWEKQMKHIQNVSWWIVFGSLLLGSGLAKGYAEITASYIMIFILNASILVMLFIRFRKIVKENNVKFEGEF